MRNDYLISAIDTHTGGAPTRIIYDPILMNVQGESIKEKQDVIRGEYDFIRKALMLEPRGYREMTGAICTCPITDGADYGLIFIDTSGYLELCGHAIVGAATAAFELGWVDPNRSEIKFDTVPGLVSVSGTFENGKVTETIMRDVASYSYGEMQLEYNGKMLAVDIAYCGNIFAILNALDFNIPPNAKHTSEWSNLGCNIRDRLNQSSVLGKLTSGRQVDIVEFSAPPDNPQANFKSIVIFGEGQVDREPCATGTCAKMACLSRKGKLNVGDVFVQESIIGTLAKAKVVDVTEVKGYKGIMPEIRYSVFVTGIHQFLIDNQDPLKEGYLLP